jgi:hypothetical protein
MVLEYLLICDHGALFVKIAPWTPTKALVKINANTTNISKSSRRACQVSPERLANPEQESPAQGETLPKMSAFSGKAKGILTTACRKFHLFFLQKLSPPRRSRSTNVFGPTFSQKGGSPKVLI